MNDATEFLRPRSIDEAVAMLAAHEDARPLAGGATLVAMLNAGLIEPDAIVSLSGIEELRGIQAQENGGLRIGAMTRHAETAASALFRDGQQVVPHAAGQIANMPVRNMGTMGGSISFADPAIDYPPALTAAGAEIEIAGPGGTRRVPC
ncbi:MAG: FAD binding domain-containing protein, partial [Rhodovibrionaceae bacterium]